MRNARLFPVLLVLVAALPLAGCGAGGFLEAGIFVPIGTVYAENSTSTFPDTVMYDFVLWPSASLGGGGNLLPFPLLPGESLAVADVDEDFYDADAQMSDAVFDYLETWFDVFVPGDDTTVFFAF